MENNSQEQNATLMQPPAVENGTKWLKIVLLIAVGMILLGGVFFAGVKFNALKQQSFTPPPNQQEEIAETSKIVFPTSKLAYNSNGNAKIYDFRDNQEIDLGLSGVTQFLWSKNGQLAVLVQGKYGEAQGLLEVPRAFASTAGFNYLLYLVDLEGKKPKLILPEVFGEVFWSENSTGFYISEAYRDGRSILLGEQSGLEPDEIKTFFVTLDGTKKPINKEVFDKTAMQASGQASPSNRFYIKAGDITDFDKIIETGNGKEYPLKPGAYYRKTFNAKWSPDGEKIAFLYKVSDEATKNSILNIVSLDEVLTQNFHDKLKSSLPSAESVSFDWIDSQSIVVNQLNYLSQPGHYQGNIGIYDVINDKFRVLIPSITQEYSNILRISPDREFFIYQTSKNIDEEEIVIADITGKEIKRLNGRDPSWEPLQ